MLPRFHRHRSRYKGPSAQEVVIGQGSQQSALQVGDPQSDDPARLPARYLYLKQILEAVVIRTEHQGA